MQVGIDSFAAAFDDSSLAGSPQNRLRDLVEQIELADQVELDVFDVGEYHRREFLDSAPAVILGGAAARTHRIRLTSPVTVLSAADSMRVCQNFAMLDKRGASGISQISLQINVASLSHAWLMKAIKTIDTRVVPLVRDT